MLTDAPSHADPNSRAAAASVQHRVAFDRRLIWLHIRDVGNATCDEVEQALGLSHQTASARLNGLYRDACVDRVGKRPTRTGRDAWIYAATPIEPVS